MKHVIPPSPAALGPDAEKTDRLLVREVRAHAGEATRAPVDQLRELVEARRSGEFICATPELEFHVYLQHGRVAWATDSGHPYEFSKDLMARSAIEEHVFREVLDACRRDKLPLGETLVAWKLASFDDVRASLLHQLRLALAGLAACGATPTIFLQRRSYADYDENLTFELADVHPPAAPARAAPNTIHAVPSAPAPAAPAAITPAATPAPAPAGARPAAPSGERSARELLPLVKGARWVEILDGTGRSLEIAGQPGVGRVSPAFAAMSLSHGADFVALRAAGGCLLGTHLGGSERQMWSMLTADATFGAAIAGLFSAGALSRRPRREMPRDHTWKRGGPAVEPVLEEAFAFGRDVLAVALLAGDALVAGVGRGLDEADCLAIGRRRSPLFTAVPLVDAAGVPAGLGLAERTLVTGEERVWCFGAEREGRPGSSLWVFTRRHSSQGVGWACLTALSRALGKVAVP